LEFPVLAYGASTGLSFSQRTLDSANVVRFRGSRSPRISFGALSSPVDPNLK